MHWLTFHYLDPKSRLWHWFKKLLVCTIMWETLIWSIQNMAVLSLQSCLLPDNIWDQFCWEHVFRGIHFFKIPDVFTQGQTLYWPHLRNSWSDRCETKRKFIGWLVGQLCDFYLTLSVTLTWIFMVKVWNRFISGIGRPIDMEWNGHESIIHDHYRDICVTLVRWVGVPDCDWCDFRHQCALDTSTCINVQERYTFAILVAFWPYCDKKWKWLKLLVSGRYLQNMSIDFKLFTLIWSVFRSDLGFGLCWSNVGPLVSENEWW